MLNNPGKPITIYDIAEIVGEAYPLAFTPRNISKSFEVTGIYPFNRDIFSEEDFLCSYVTDRPEPTSAVSESSTQNIFQSEESGTNPNSDSETQRKPNEDQVEPVAGSTVFRQINHGHGAIGIQPNRSGGQSEMSVFDEFADVAGPNKENAEITPRKQLISQVTPESIRPFSKAAPRKTNQRGRKPGKSRILTDTPEKN
ncbi:unnamed protein product [Diatraea saccharalis]|uniref:Uncharacterized protein n=1 Tax=Diatraea saccharalis TaxID=40085 RepID=A0A9N9WJ33_9NEOP|nr:unnamed protein product [Diatraea saccharalis]